MSKLRHTSMGPDLILTSRLSMLHMLWDHLNPIPKYIIERPHDVGESLNEATVMPCQPTKHVDLSVGLRHGKLLHCVYILPARMDSIT